MKEMKEVIGVEEFAALTEAMQNSEADRIREAILFVLDTGGRVKYQHIN